MNITYTYIYNESQVLQSNKLVKNTSCYYTVKYLLTLHIDPSFVCVTRRIVSYRGQMVYVGESRPLI